MLSQPSTSLNRPSFDRLVENYPGSYKYSVQALKHAIGGQVDTPWAQANISDSCTLRMSRALNRSGTYVPGHFNSLRTLRGGDGFYYAFAVQELHAWLKMKFGPPDILVKGKPVRRDKFRGTKGIIVFDIVFGLNPDGRTRAMGHADLWDGETFFDEIAGISDPQGRDFFTIADGVSLWICEGKAMLAAR